MKILHTSDLHIGKKLMGRERYAEYRAVLAQIREICIEEKVDLVLVAGDVFDTYTPSAEAEEIFYSGIKRIAEVAAVLIISGNHDDYVRLTAAAAIAEELNVYITGNNLQAVRCGKRGETYPVESGCGWVVFENSKGERVYINALPYPNEARFKEGKSDESFTDKAARWISAGEAGKGDKIPSVFLSHIFVAGGAVSDSEREIDLGGARAVPMNILPNCNYCALGHLHRRQKLGKNAYYCGAPMQFSFDESGSQKSVNVFEVTRSVKSGDNGDNESCFESDVGSGVENFKQIEITAYKKLIRLQAASPADGVALLKKNTGYFVELTLHLTAPLTPTESAALHENENLVSLKADVKGAEENADKVSNRDKSSSELFSDYYKKRYGAEVSNDLLSLFLSLTEEE